MCGLAGVASRFISSNEQKVFEDILTMATMRGRQGSGVILVDEKKGHVNTFKSTANAVSLLEEKRYDELQLVRRSVMIGHARQPTKGSLTLPSVHPHTTDHITGVHNGTVWRVNGSIVGEESDSKLLFADIAKRGVDAAIKDVKGAYALIWIDRKDKTLNFLRNSDRPLWFGQPGEGAAYTLYWGSEQNMVLLAMLRQNLHKPHIYELKPDVLHTLPMVPSGALTFETREVKQDKEFFQGGTGTRYGNYGGYGTGGSYGGGYAYGGQHRGYEASSRETQDGTWGWKNAIWTKTYRNVVESTPKITSSGEAEGETGAKEKVDPFPAGDEVGPAEGSLEHSILNKLWPRRKVTKSERAKLKAAGVPPPSPKAHNVGHNSYGETLRNFFLSRPDIETILQKTRCAYCNTAETLENFDRKNIRWLDKKEFLCVDCSDDVKVRNNLREMYPAGWPELEGSDEPKSVDEQLAETMREAHKFH